jgi:hypothetical protein
MVMPETKETLKKVYLNTREMPNKEIIDMQRGILAKLGFNPDYACSCLNNVAQIFPNDQEIFMKMQLFALSAELACKEACMTDEEKEKYYKEMPSFMHWFPQSYMLQKRSSQAMQMQKGQEYVMTILNTPEGRMKVDALGSKMTDIKQSVEAEVMTWDFDKRHQYSNEFCEEDNIKSLSNAMGIDIDNHNNDKGDDFVEKFNKFLDIDDLSLIKIFKMQIVLQTDLREGGKLMNLIRDKSPNSLQILQALQKITYGITSAAGRGMDANQQHQHGPHCQHNKPQKASAPDVTTGITEQIER